MIYKKTYIVLFLYTTFLVVVPFSHPNLYIFLPCLVGSTVSLVSLYLMYTFLGSAPDAQQTITNSLHMHISFLFALLVIRETILSFLFNVTYGSAKLAFESYPTLMCSITTPRLLYMPVHIVYFLIAMSKLYMVIYPLHFPGLDHNLLGKLAIATTIFLPALDSALRLLTNITICNRTYLAVLIQSYDLNIRTDIGDFMSPYWPMILGVAG